MLNLFLPCYFDCFQHMSLGTYITDMLETEAPILMFWKIWQKFQKDIHGGVFFNGAVDLTAILWNSYERLLLFKSFLMNFSVMILSSHMD